MRNIRIEKKDALDILTQDEGHFFDRKALGINGRGIQKIAIAFANADGGEFIVGIKDEKEEPVIEKRWSGAEVPEEFNGLLQALFDVQPTLSITYDALFSEEFEGYLLRVSVDKSSDVHKTRQEKVYIRYGAQSLPVTDPQKILELTFAKGAASFEDHSIDSISPDALVDSEEINRFLEEYSPKTDPLDFLINQHLIDNSSWNPTYAGVLLFYSNPSVALPRRCAVKITRYETREDEPEREHLSEQRSLEGSLYQLIHNSVSEVTDIMSNVSIWTTEGMKKVSYPPETIWEIITNAIIHRDYSVSDDIQILIFDNRIEVLSPGKLPGYVTVSNILDSRYSRNPKIVRTLNRYKNPPNKDLGEGLNTAFQKMKEWKLQSPTIIEDENYVKVIIPHTPLAKPEELIMEYLETHESIKNIEARELTGIKSENQVKSVFLRLARDGRIERVPGLRGSASRWQKT
ncbi:MAG: ATP-binding protein [Candidatus Thiodiazotropha sp.]